MINQNITEQEAKELIEAEIVRLAGGDEQKLWRLRRYQHSISKELCKYQDPIARMNRMVELFWQGVKEFHDALQKR